MISTRENQKLLSRIARHLMLYVNTINDIGLINGKMGIAIFFYHYSRYTGNILYHDFARELIDDIYKDINKALPFDFETGFCGIGWGLLHLVDEKFLNADSDDVLSELDLCVMEKDVRKISDITIYKGLAGIACYVLLRKTISRQYIQELVSNMDSKGFVSNEFDFLKSCLKKINSPQETTIHSTEILSWLLIGKVSMNSEDNFLQTSKLGIGKNGLSGIGLNLILNKDGKN